MDSSNELNPIDDNSNHLLSSPCNLNGDSGDIIDCPNINSENDQRSIKLQLIVHASNHSLLENDGLAEPYPALEDSVEKSHHIKTKYSFITEHPLTHVNSQHAILIQKELEGTLFDNRIETTGEKQKEMLL